jgi:hypothetical protein
MGAIYEFDLQPWIEKYGFKNYVETGGGLGTCLEWALKYKFDQTYSIELDNDFAANLKVKFPKSIIIDDTSISGLERILKSLPPDPCLFFHDAHFIGNPDHQKTTYEAALRLNGQANFPLKEEIALITKSRDVSKDGFIIDDIALYDDNINCQWHQMGHTFPYRKLCNELGIELDLSFITTLFRETHHTLLDKRSQGYLVILPK